MVKWLMRRGIGAFERTWNYHASYLREILDASPRAAWLFGRVTALGKYRRDVPIEAWSAAGITAVRHEDCGPCTQLGMAMAERAGVRPDVLRALLEEDADAMPAERRVNVIVGSDRAARPLIGVSRKGLRDATARFALVNGLPGLIGEGAGGLIQTVAFEIAEDDRIRPVYVVRNPEKLRHLSPATA